MGYKFTQFPICLFLAVLGPQSAGSRQLKLESDSYDSDNSNDLLNQTVAEKDQDSVSWD